MTQPDGLGGFWSTLKSAATGVIPGMVAGAAVGAAVSGPFAPIGAAVGAAAGAFAGSSKGIKSQMDADRTAGEFTGQGSGEVDNTGALVVGVSAGDGAFRLPCGSGPGAQVKNCCPPNWQTKSVRVNPDGSTGVTCSNGDLVTVKGTQVFSRVTRAELEGLFNTVGTVYEVTKAQDTARKLAAARVAAQAKADAALRSPATQEAVAVQSSNRALVVVGLMLAAGVGTYLYTRRR